MALSDEPSASDSDVPGDRAADLDRVFGPDGWAPLAASVRARELFHRRGTERGFAGLFGWDDLSRLLETTPLAQPRIALVRGGRPIAEDAYLRHREGIARFDAGMLTRQLDEGATLIVNFLDEMASRVAELCDALAEALDLRTSANLYASWRAEHGLPLHWDRHGVLVVQLAGRKRWTVHTPTRPDPLEGDAFVAPAAGARPAWEGLLEDGDMLYLPRGHPHNAEAVDGPSLHLTIALIEPTAHGYLRWLGERLRDDPRWRANLPESAKDEAAFLAELRASLDEALTPASLAAYRSARAAEKPARPRFAFPALDRSAPQTWDGRTRLRLASQRKLALGGGVQLGGTLWPCAEPVARALARLSDARAIALGDLEDGLEPDERAELRRLLSVLHLGGGLASSRDGVSQPRPSP